MILASAFLHALWNARLKRQPQMDVAGSVIFLVNGLVALLAALLAYAWTGETPLPSWASFAWSIAAGVCEAGYFTLLVLAFKAAPLGTVYAVSRGFAILAAWPVSVLFIGETATPLAIAGAVLLVLGLGFSSLRVTAANRGIALALGAGVFIAGFHLAYKLAIEAGGAPPAVFAVSLGLAVPVNLALLPAARRALLLPVWRERLVSLTTLGVVCAASFLLVLAALEVVGAGYALTLRNASILFTLLMAWQMGDALSARQWAGAGLIAVGAGLLGLA